MLKYIIFKGGSKYNLFWNKIGDIGVNSIGLGISQLI